MDTHTPTPTPALNKQLCNKIAEENETCISLFFFFFLRNQIDLDGMWEVLGQKGGQTGKQKNSHSWTSYSWDLCDPQKQRYVAAVLFSSPFGLRKKFKTETRFWENVAISDYKKTGGRLKLAGLVSYRRQWQQLEDSLEHGFPQSTQSLYFSLTHTAHINTYLCKETLKYINKHTLFTILKVFGERLEEAWLTCSLDN